MPGFVADWHLGVRVTSNRKLVGFITGIPATVRVNTASVSMVEINFLCVHKKLRSKRLAPVLIKVRHAYMLRRAVSVILAAVQSAWGGSWCIYINCS